jgi:hypothetical protein
MVVLGHTIKTLFSIEMDPSRTIFILGITKVCMFSRNRRDFSLKENKDWVSLIKK